MPDDLTAVRLVATGHVQGVGFRYFVQAVGRAHGLVGWVRNREDGAVEAELVGSSMNCEAAIAKIRAGRMDQIRRLSVEPIPLPRAPMAEFEIRP